MTEIKDTEAAKHETHDLSENQLTNEQEEAI